MTSKHRISPIGEIVKDVFSKLESEKNFSKEDIDSYWKELVGERGFKHSKPASLRQKVLTVWVDSSGWLQELSMRKRQFLKGLKRALGKDRISEIRFKIGEF